MASGEQLVDDSNFENLLRPHRATLTPRCLERLKVEAGLDLTQKLRARYPRNNFDAALKVLAEELYGPRGLEAGTQQLGEDLMAPFQDSLAGKAIFRMVRLIPIGSVLKRMPGFMRIGNNYIEATVTQAGRHSFELTFNEMGAHPHYWLGVLRSAAQLLGYREATVTLKGYDGHRGTLVISLQR